MVSILIAIAFIPIEMAFNLTPMGSNLAPHGHSGHNISCTVCITCQFSLKSDKLGN